MPARSVIFALDRRITSSVSNPKSRHLAALALLAWYLMMPPDSPKIPHAVDAEVPLARWIVITSFDTEENCEKALADVQNNETDPVALDKTGKLKRLDKHDAALGKARAINAACVASDDIRLKGRK
jgi:lipocalin